MQAVTITQITPNELEALIENSIQRAFSQRKEKELIEPDSWLTLSELCQYHPDKPSKPTVYGWVSAGTIPVHKGSKKLRFLKSEIDNWLKHGRKQSLIDYANEADAYLSQKRKGGSHA